MAQQDDLIRNEANGTISFGDYTLDEKSKVSDFEHDGDLYKVKTFFEITKLEKNGLFVYESVPGTRVENFCAQETQVSFLVSGKEDAQITLELEPEKTYDVFIDEADAGDIKTNLGGKLILSVELNIGKTVSVKVVKRG